jgi:RNA polymerase sigma factor (sigma-70 family)
MRPACCPKSTEPSGPARRVLDVRTADLASAAGSPVVTDVTDRRAPLPELHADFATFYDRTHGRIARALALTLRDHDLALDATDEAMTRAYSRWSQVSLLDNSAGWVYRVGLNWGRSVLRRRLRPRRTVHDPNAELPHIADPAIAAAIARLDVDQRAVVVCRYFLDWSEADIAFALDIKPGTVKSRLHRALRNLETRLAHLAPGADA